MDNLQNDDKSQDLKETSALKKGAVSLETIVIVVGLLVYVTLSCWGLARAGFRPCTAGDCTIFPAQLTEGQISNIDSK